MSHITGTVQPAAIEIGPDSGAAADSGAPDTWTHAFAHDPAPTGTKLLILHFAAASLPASNRLEVDLGYGGADSMDVFTVANGSEFWTRPVNVAAFAEGKVPIRYITNGAANGGARIDKYGRGERHIGHSNALSNCDPFLVEALLEDGKYVEPTYDPYWFCKQPPNWENVACIPAGDIRREVARSVGMFVHVDHGHEIPVLSTCSVTLIGPNLVVTAGHCMAHPEEDAKSCSVIFNYELECGGERPAGYAGRFFKVSKVVAHGHDKFARVDYCLFELAVAPGLPAIQLRHDIPTPGEQAFCIHHPNGAVKKLSVPRPAFAQLVDAGPLGVKVSDNLHVSGGSSGSGLFDMAGRILGVLADGDPCNREKGGVKPLRYYPMASILKAVATSTVPSPITRDVMIVIDRSASMSLAGSSGRPKIEEARDAASLFVKLVRAGAGNRVGLVSFSTGANVDFDLQDATNANEDVLVGAAPYSAGLVGALTADGLTTIGGGLQAAAGQLPGGGAILLLTDGLQNTPPMIGAPPVQAAIEGIEINAIGYGTPANLDGALLTALAQAHDGQYVRADSSLQLEKYFAQAFGNIFENGLLADPEFVMEAEQHVAAPLPFNVCDEETVTVVVGWDNLATAGLLIEVRTPGGANIHAGAPGTESADGRTWAFLRIPLPHGGERDGTWNVVAFRPGGSTEFPLPAPETRYFINVIADGGPRIERGPIAEAYYTGDPINPLVALSYGSGKGSPHDIKIRLTVTRPIVAAGNLLSQEGLHAPVAVGGDTIPACQATLQAIEAQTGKPAISYTQSSFDMHDDPASTNGAFEPRGLFGKPMTDLLTIEGDYTFHAVATYGDRCTSSRELQWSIHVMAGVDPDKTEVTSSQTGTGAGGAATGTATIIPRDPYGNKVGPGRGGGLTVTGGAGTAVTGPVVDNGDGSYTVPVAWDPGSGGPSVAVGQPGRPPVVVGGGGGGGGGAGPASHHHHRRHCWWCIMICLMLAMLAIVLLLMWWFK